jgi:hypothetical protein
MATRSGGTVKKLETNEDAASVMNYAIMPHSTGRWNFRLGICAPIGITSSYASQIVLDRAPALGNPHHRQPFQARKNAYSQRHSGPIFFSFTSHGWRFSGRADPHSSGHSTEQLLQFFGAINHCL